MGLIRLRTEDVRLARDDRFADPLLDCDWRGKALDLRGHLEQTADRMGLAIVDKPDLGTALSRMSTTYYREIRLGTGYAEKNDSWKTVTLAHELVHARQWRHWGPGTFRTRYLFWTRWRWAVEVQAYRESVRCLVALGARQATVEGYIGDRPRVLWDNYAIRGLRQADVEEYTVRLLVDSHIKAKAMIARPR